MSNIFQEQKGNHIHGVYDIACSMISLADYCMNHCLTSVIRNVVH